MKISGHVFSAFCIAASLLLNGCISKPRELKWRGLNNPNLKLESFSEEQPAQQTSIFTSRTKNLRVRIIERPANEAEAKILWTGLKMQVEGFFAEYPAPYPGFISNKSACDEKFKPKPAGRSEDSTHWKDALLLYSNDRFLFGSCIAGDLSYRALVSVFFCKKSQRSYEIKVFEDSYSTDFSNLLAILKGFSC